MDHTLTLHSDCTLTITLPKDAKVSRVVVNGASYRQVTGKLDLIRRQDAIEACESIKRSAIIEDGETLVRKSAVKYVLENLPSAQTEIIRCTECKHYREYDSEYVENAVVVQCMADRYPISETIPDGWFCAGAERKDDE